MAAPIGLAPSCATCVFGAVSSSLLSFPAHTVETITVEVIPHITVFTNGSEVTHYSSITQTEIDVIGTSTGTSDRTTYTNTADLTWTFGDATLTYPTTYVHYLGFDGAVTGAGTSKCAEAYEASSVALPANTNPASFIYALSANTTAATELPAALLQYLGDIPAVSAQFHGAALSACAPLSSADVTPPPPTLAPSPLMPSTPSLSSSQTFQRNAVNGSWTGNGTHTGNHTRTLQHSPNDSVSSIVIYSDSSTTTTTNTQPQSASLTHPAGPQDTHSTAFVLQPITGRAIVTTESAPTRAPDLGGHGGNGGGNGATTTAGGNKPGGAGSSGGGGDGGGNGDVGGNGGSGNEGPSGNGGGSGNHSGGGNGGGSGNEGGSGNGGGNDNGGGSGNGGGNVNTGGSGSDAGNNVGGEGDGGRGNSGNSGSNTPNSNGGGDSIGNHRGGSNPPNNPAVYNAGTTAVTAKSDGAIAFGGKTIQPGQSVTLGSGDSTIIVALQTSGHRTELVVGSKTYGTVPGSAAETKARPGPSEAVITTAGKTFTAVQSGGSVILEDGSSTMTLQAGSVATFDGEKVSRVSFGKALVVNGKTTPFSAAATPTQALVTVDGKTFTAQRSGGSLILGDASSTITMKEGSATQFDGQSVTAASSDNAIIVNGRKIPLSTGVESSEAIVTAGGHTITAIEMSGSAVLEDGSSTVTIDDGSATHFEDQSVSIKPGGNAIVVNGKTIMLTPKSTTTTDGLSGYITSGLSGPNGQAANTKGAATMTQNQGRATSVPLAVAACGFLFGAWAMI